MSCYAEDSDKKCRVCGNRNISRWHSGKYGRPPYYCSFKCRNIGERVTFLILSIVTLVASVILIVFIIQDSGASYELVIPLVMSIFGFLILFSFAVHGYRSYNDNLQRRIRGSTTRTTAPRTATFYPTPSEYRRETFTDKKFYPQYTEEKDEDIIFVETFPAKSEAVKNICMICKLKITINEMVYKCPYCDNHFHENHLDEWLNTSKNCPVCGETLKK